MSKVRVQAFFWLFFFFLLENAWNAVFFGTTPSFLVIGVVFYALAEGPLFGFWIGCYAGAFLEIFATGPLGLEMAVLGICGAWTGWVSSKIFRESLLTQVLLPVSVSFLAAFSGFFLAHVRFEENMGFEILKNAFGWPRALGTALFSPFVFRVLKPRMHARKRLSLFS